MGLEGGKVNLDGVLIWPIILAAWLMDRLVGLWCDRMAWGRRMASGKTLRGGFENKRGRGFWIILLFFMKENFWCF